MRKLNLSFALAAAALAFSMQASAQFTPVQEQSIEKTALLNGGFEGGKGTWTAYKDAAGAAPVDGVSGTPVVMSIAGSTSSPLAGKSSGVISHTAANGQGEGISKTFTLEPEMKGRPLSIQGVYTVNSGTYSGGTSSTDSDVVLYVYDVDTSTLIQPSAYKLDGGVSGITYTFSATFQSHITSTNYRLIAHNANTTATAFSLKLDQIKIGLQNRPMGPPVTDWVSYTPTGAWSTGTYTGKWRRVGDSMEVYVHFLVSSAPTGSFTATIPSGYTIDTTKIAGTPVSYSNNLGSGGTQAAGTAYNALSVGYSNTTTLTAWALNGLAASGHAYGAVTPTNPATYVATDFVSFTARIPIVGWGSNTIVSSDASSRPVNAVATSSTSPSVGATAKIPFNTVVKDSHGAFDTTNNRYSIKVPGTFTFSGALNYGASGALTTAFAHLYKNGVLSKTIQVGVPSGASFGVPYTFQDDAVAGDYYEIWGQNSTAATLSASTTVFNIKMDQGPSQISAATTIAANYTTLSDLAYVAAEVFKYTTKVTDTHGAYNTTTGLFTCPAPGVYKVTAHFSSNSAGNLWQYVGKNGSTELYRLGFTSATSTDGAGSAQVECVIGETLGVYASGTFNVFGAASYSFVNFERIGGIN